MRAALVSHPIVALALLAALGAAAEEPLVPEDTCILELQLPEGATVSIDGRDYGTKRRLEFGSLQRGQIYSSRLVVGFRDGSQVQRSLLLQGGWRVPLGIAAPGGHRPEILTQTGHSGTVTSVAVSPDGRYAATGSQDKTVILWDMATGRQLRRFAGHTDEIIQVAFSPNGEEIVTASKGMEFAPNEMSGDSAVMWDVVSGRKLRTFGPSQAGSYHAAFMPGGSQVLTISGKGVNLWDKTTGSHLRTFPHDLGYVVAGAMRPDGRQLALVSWQLGAKKAVLWDLATGAQVRVLDGHSQDPKYDSIHWVSFSPDGSRILTTTGHSSIVWDVATGQKLYSFTTGISLHAWAAFSPDSKSIVTGPCEGTSDKGALWDSQDGRLVRTFRGGFGWSPVVAFHPNGRQVLTGVPSLWDVDTGEELREFTGGSEWPRDVRFSPDGRYILICTRDDKAVLWNPGEGKVQQTLEGKWPIRIERASFSADGQRLLTWQRNRPAAVWDIATGQAVQVFDKKIAGDDPNYAAISPDGRQVLLALDSGQVGLWEVDTARKVRDLVGQFKSLDGLAFSSDGRLAATGSDYQKATIWDVPSGQPIRSFGEEVLSNVGSVEFSWDNRKLMVKGTSARIFDIATGQEMQRILWQGNEMIGRIAFSPDASQVLAGYSAGTVLLYSASTGGVLRTFQGHTDLVEAIAFSPDGRRILTGSRDNTVRCWSVATGEELFSLTTVNKGQDWLLATPEGLFDGSEGARQKVSFRVGGGLNVVPVDRFFQDFYRPGLLTEIWRGQCPMPRVDFAAKTAPLVRLQPGVESGTVETPEISLQAEVTDRGGGVKGPWLTHNGSQVLAPDRPIRNGKLVRRTFAVKLVEGENRLEVHAASEDGSWESEPAVLTVRYQTPLERPQLHLVAVGVSRYAQETMNLKFAADDAQAIAKVFSERGPRLYGQGKVHVHPVLDLQATKPGIKQALDEVARQAKPQDTLVLFLAGHGTMLGQRYYFIPSDFKQKAEKLEDDVRQQGLPGDELDDALQAVPALKRVVIYDTCQSGGTMALSRTARDAFAFRGELERMSRATGSFAIAATAATAKAHEVDELRHGVLTYALLAGAGAVSEGPLAKQTVAPDKPVVEVRDWFSYAQDKVPLMTKLFLGEEQLVGFTGQGSSFPILPLDSQEAKIE